MDTIRFNLNYGWLASDSKNIENYKSFYLLCKRILDDRQKGVNALLNKIEDIDFKDVNDITPLRFAVLMGRLKSAEALINRNANVNDTFAPEDKSILIIAIKFGAEPEMLRLLLKHGAEQRFQGEDSFYGTYGSS